MKTDSCNKQAGLWSKIPSWILLYGVVDFIDFLELEPSVAAILSMKLGESLPIRANYSHLLCRFLFLRCYGTENVNIE